MKRFPTYALLLGLLFAAGVARAAEVTGVYEAEVPVADQQDEARTAAMKSGMAEVLVRVTGNGAVAKDPGLAELLDNAPHYVQQYRYRAAPAAGDGAAVIPGSAPAPLILWMAFDPNSINQALRAHNQPVWGKARPLVLAWLAVDGGNGRRLVAAAEGGVEQQALEAEAKRRGLPLRLPLLDLQDQSKVSAADVWGGFVDSVAAASARYQPQAILLGRLYRDGQGGWHARWTLRAGDDVINWDGAAAAPADVVAAGVDVTTDTLAARFAQLDTVTANSQLTLRIADVANLDDYSRVLTYLKSLNGVTSVQVRSVDPRTLVCSLTLQVGAPAVIRTISLGNTLAAAPASVPQPEQPQTELSYRLLP